MLSEKTGWLDTHPSPKDRIARVQALAEGGYEISDEPAAALFENFQGLSRLVTLAHYDDDLNVPITPEFLISIEQFISPTAAAGSVPAAPVSPLPMMSFDPTQLPLNPAESRSAE